MISPFYCYKNAQNMMCDAAVVVVAVAVVALRMKVGAKNAIT